MRFIFCGIWQKTSLTQHQPASKPIEQVQVGERIMLPGHPMPRIVNSKETLPDGTIILHLGIDPDDNPDDSAFSDMEQANRIHDACLEAQYTGATHVGTVLKTYKAVAEFYAYGPLYNLEFAGAGVLSSTASEMLQASSKAKAAATYMRGLLAKSQALLPKLKQRLAGVAKGSDEAAQLTSKIDDLEAGARRLSHGADELDDAAKHADDLAKAAQGAVAVASGNCFIAGTPVLMADGSFKAIEQVHAGDMVASKEIGTGKQSAKRVVRTFLNTAKVLLTLTLSNGERITTTPGHPFATSERGNFVLAGNLPLQAPLVALGQKAALSSSRSFAGQHNIYNFEVEDFHTYFVGKSRVWVHNTSRDVVREGLANVDITMAQWNTFPANATRPEGPFQLLGAANNQAMRNAFEASGGAKQQFRRLWEQAHPNEVWNSHWEIHHIKPLKFGGTNDLGNLEIMTDPNVHREITQWWWGTMWDAARAAA